MFSPLFIAPASNLSLLYQRSGRFKLFAPHQETENPDVEVFFNIQFNRTSSPNANKENVSRFGCSYTLDLTAHTCNEKISITIYWLFDYYINGNVKSVVKSIPSRFSKFGSRCWKVHLHTGLHLYRVYREFRRFSVCHKKFLDVLKVVKCNIYFRHKIDFPFHIYKSVVNANLKKHLLLDRDNDMDQDKGKPLAQPLLWYWGFFSKILLIS